MQRRPEALDGPFDLLVVGGGIYGAWTAYDAALRGLRVALVEREDWGAGTSQSSTKLIHGGLRYLEGLEIGLVRRTLSERRRLLALGPHRVRPLRFVAPVYRRARLGCLRLALGLGLYDLIAGRAPGMPRHRRLSRHALLQDWPFLETDGLRGGFAYYDAVTDDARLVLELVDGALAANAVCVNHAEAVLVEQGGRIVGAQVTDGMSGRVHAVRASITVNAAGPWAATLAGMPVGAAPRCRLVKGVHLVLPPLPMAEALLLTAQSDGRVFFAIPWYGNTLLGTTETDHVGAPSDIRVDEADIDYLLAEAGRALAGIQWTRADLRGAFAGVRTLRDDRAARVSDVSREWTLERPAPGLLMPVGGKLTSSRAEAALIVDAVMDAIGRPAGGRPGTGRCHGVPSATSTTGCDRRSRPDDRSASIGRRPTASPSDMGVAPRPSMGVFARTARSPPASYRRPRSVAPRSSRPPARRWPWDSRTSCGGACPSRSWHGSTGHRPPTPPRSPAGFSAGTRGAGNANAHP